VNSTDVRRRWAERSGEYSPAYYAYYGPDDRSEAVRAVLERYVGRDASVLELGCSSGRHLAYLHDHGFADLAGVEVNDDALDVMADAYPDLAENGSFHFDAIENVVERFDDGRFDAVFSVETLQHLHPDADWVFAELARITDGVLVTVENEGDGEADAAGTEDVRAVEREGPAERDVVFVRDDVPLYYRDWNRVFTDLGLVEVEARAGERDTVRVFRSPGE
jgi:SAM-dependent methyltransferase